MRITEVLIHNYKSICSEIKECRLKIDEKVTILIGANESGKTNILEALTKFSLGGFEVSDVPQTCPWHGQTTVPDDLIMVSVTYTIEKKDRKLVEKIHPALVEAGEVTITRNYNGDPYISSPDLKTETGLNDRLDTLKSVSKDFEVRFKAYIKEYRKVNKGNASFTLSASKRMRSLVDQIEASTESFSASEISPTSKKVRRLLMAVNELANPLSSIDSEVIQPLGEIQSIVESLKEYLDEMRASQRMREIVPEFAFVPTDPQLWLSGQYLVDDILNKPENDEYAGVRRLLQLANMKLEDILALKDEVQRPQLEKASKKITKAIRDVWKQEENIQIKLDWSSGEGNKRLHVMVESTGHNGFPEYRSYGFRWFLEFYLLHAVALKERQVLLFEEPGIHLHPDAQEYLKSCIRDQVAAENQVIYSTHLPDMYDLAYPEGCRAIEKDLKRDGVTTVQTKYSPDSQHATWEVAMKAVGMSSPLLRTYNRNLIVEGPSDWIYFLTLAQCFAREEPKLSDLATGFIHIRHYRGTGGILMHIPFHFQPGAKSVVVLDSDKPGETLKKRLKEELHIPNKQIKVLMVNEVKNVKEELGDGYHEVEDLFGIECYTSMVNSTLEKRGVKIDSKDFKDTNMIGDEAMSVVNKKHGIVLRKDDVAWQFRDLTKAKKIALPDEAKLRFKSLLLKAIQSL